MCKAYLSRHVHPAGITHTLHYIARKWIYLERDSGISILALQYSTSGIRKMLIPD